MSGTPRTAGQAIGAGWRRDASAADAHGVPGSRSSWYYLGPALLVFATFATFRRREISEIFEGGADAEVQVKLAIWALLGLIALWRLPIILRSSQIVFTFPLAPYVVFCGLALASTAWSPQPALSGIKAVQLLIVIALGLSMIDRVHEWPKLAAIYLGLNWAFLLVGLTGAVPALHWRELPGFQEAGYDGITQPWRLGTPLGHFSIISLVAAMLAVSRAARIRRGPTFVDSAVFLWAAATVLLTVSRTGVLGLVLGTGVVVVLRSALPLAALALGALGSLSFLVPGLVDAVEDFLERGQDAEELASLTGRTGIYDSALGLIGDNWLIGNGFRASRTARLNQFQDNEGNTFGTASHAHNAVLESVSSLGLAGGACAVAILLSFLVCALALFFRTPRGGDARVGEDGVADERARAVEYCAYWPPIFAFSIMDSSFALEINAFVLFFIAVLFDFARSRARLGAAASAPRARRPAIDGVPQP